MRLEPVSLAALAFLLLGAADEPEREPPACTGWGLVFFESGSAQVDSRAAYILDNFASLTSQSEPRSRVTIRGNADRLGNSAFNMRLSRSRAKSVRNYLVSKGLSAGQIQMEAAGESRPLVETADGVPERNNRYVEVSEFLDPVDWDRRIAWWAKHGRPTIVC